MSRCKKLLEKVKREEEQEIDPVAKPDQDGAAEVDVLKIIEELIDTEWSKDNDSQGHAAELIKELADSEEPVSNKFMEELDKFSSELEIGKFEEMAKKKKK